jgi:hydroxyacylglutathione hydrolase
VLKVFINNKVNNAHAYLLVNEVEHNAVLIDTAMMGKEIKEYLDTYQLVLTDIFITHYHVDHTLGIDLLQNEFNAIVHINEKDFDALFDPERNGIKRGLENNIDGSKTFERFDTETNFQINSFDIKAIPFGGHTPGTTFYVVNNKYALVGDTLFIDKIGFHNKNYQGLVDCDDQKFFDSIDYILNNFQEYKICPGHHEEFFTTESVVMNKSHPYHTMRD